MWDRHLEVTADHVKLYKRLLEEICPEARIIAVSGYGDDEARRRTKDAGFDHHFVKPVDFDALISLLSRPWPAT